MNISEDNSANEPIPIMDKQKLEPNNNNMENKNEKHQPKKASLVRTLSKENHLPTIHEATPELSVSDDGDSRTLNYLQIALNTTQDIFKSYRFSHLLTLLLMLANMVMLFSRFASDEDLSEFLFHRSKKVQGVEEDIRRLHQTLSTLDNLYQETNTYATEDDLQNNTNHSFAELDMKMNEVEDLKERVKVLSKSADDLRVQVKDWSRREIDKRYGYGIHRVEVELAFPGEVEGPNKFVIELADADEMPHSVHVFLDMVTAGLLDGCSFILKTLHILKAAPLPHDGSSAAVKARSFTKKGLESVAFKEYSEKYPPQQYTVGFAANGGPGFYINTKDNTELHAGDPCFGKIVSGFDTVRRMEESETTHGMWLKERIGIKRARIV